MEDRVAGEGDALLGNANRSVVLSQRSQVNSEEGFSKKRWLITKKKLYTTLLSTLTVLLISGSAYAASVTLPDNLGWRNIVSTTAVLVAVGVIPLSFAGMGPLVRSLMVSASRCAIQVSLLGSVVLQRMMGVTRPWILVAWIVGVGLLSGRECASRIQYTYPEMNRNIYGSVLASGVSIWVLTVVLNLFGKIEPWFDPQTWIPIAGMLFGNTLNAITLGTSSITKQFATNADAVELRWMRGASNKEAIGPLMEESFRLSLLPTVNGLAATGIIYIPGMMSGQIIAGQSPNQAAVYQIVISFLIASTGMLAVQLIVHLSVGSIVERRWSRLRSGVLKPKETSAKKNFLKSIFSKPEERNDPSLPTHSSNPLKGQLRSLSSENLVSKKGTPINVSTPVLELKGLEVPRANAKVELSLRSGDRIAISGKSGTGKSQILRTILGFEESGSESQILLFGNVVDSSDLPAFRSKVCMVPANRVTLEGTPNQLYEQILQMESQQQRGETIRSDPITPGDIVRTWDLDPSALDRDWRTLSGGESQRAALAIALALKPDVLLLDESTSAMDLATSILVENTLRESNIPMIVVTHSEDQLERFCTERFIM